MTSPAYDQRARRFVPALGSRKDDQTACHSKDLLSCPATDEAD